MLQKKHKNNNTIYFYKKDFYTFWLKKTKKLLFNLQM